MRKFFLIGIGLFGLSLSQPSSAQAPGFQPVGTIRQIMLGIVTPTSDVIFAVPSKPRKDDKDWETVQRSALTLSEVGNLLMIPGHAKDKGDWMKYSKQLIDA